MSDIKTINSIEQFDEIVASNIAVLIYFSTTSCSVGEALEPKVQKLVATEFPYIKFYSVDLNFSPEVAAKYSAFVEPTILIFFEGKETIRKSRNISIYELQKSIDRPYKLIFN